MENIESYLPHRQPFLFVDDARVEGSMIMASRSYKPEEWFFKGHFPAYPVVPGVLLVEALAQAGGVGAKLLGIKPKGLFVLARIRSATFRRQVRPGERLDMEVWNIKSGALVLHQKGRGLVDGQVAVEAEWVSMSSGVEE
ncbi:MAG: beta-hydroxyacyl-ACP dehydratase [Spirochaetae bacterium HGW-Spirochaetae-9]|nr:MAG: beta-hydroxyacyl-ACP dehydratase [Spirochaetae bacterium HGW-Spirochaetae-9]